MKDGRIARLLEARKRLARQMPAPSTALAGSLLTRMIHCNKSGCRACQEGKGPGHGPISLLSVSLGAGRVRQIPIPKHLQAEVGAGVRRFADIQRRLKQIASVNQELLQERKKKS
jgi:hypothetical protein